jgi:hypothetical protein
MRFHSADGGGAVNEPLHLTPLERYADDLMRFENWERYTQQSAATKTARAAQLPPRQSWPLMQATQFTDFAKR